MTRWNGDTKLSRAGKMFESSGDFLCSLWIAVLPFKEGRN